MRDETKEAMRMFLGGRCYTAENLERDYLAEVPGYSDDRWEAPQRAARLAAAVKRYKDQREHLNRNLRFCSFDRLSTVRFSITGAVQFINPL